MGIPADRRSSLTIIAVLAGLALANGVQAADFALSGEVRDKRGTIEIPLPSTLLAPAPGMTAMGTAMQTGAALPGGGPATITLPPNVLSDVPTIIAGFVIPVPSVIQLTTLIAHHAPTVSTTVMAGRSGPTNFAFCPGATANPNCTTVAAGGSQGTLNGILKYTAGPNKFGGTLKMLLTGSGTLTNKGDPLPPTTMTAMGGTATALPFSALNNALGGAGGGFAGAGLSYGAMLLGYQDPAIRTHPYGYMSTPKGLLTRGPNLGIGGAVYNQQTAFPVTTGQVYGYRQIAAQAGAGGPPTRHTTTGYDKRTAGGVGRIFLVGGGLSRTYPVDNSNPPEGSVINRVNFIFTFTPQPALPLSSPAVLITLGSLIVLSAGFAVARRSPANAAAASGARL